jgi:parvulin-like peptidyl-prolyl isomerase
VSTISSRIQASSGLLVLLVSLLVALLTVGCARENPNIAATVNGAQIPVDRMNAEVDEALRDPQAPPQLKNDPTARKRLQTQVLDQIVQTTLIEQAAKDMGVTVTDQEVQARLADLIAQVGGPKVYQQRLSEHGLTEASVASRVRSDVLVEKARKKVQDRVQVSDAEIQKVYTDATGARHILVATQQDAQKLKDRIAAGEDFGTLAKERSTDESTKAKGGDLGFVKRGAMVPEFEQALFAAKPGEVVGPVQTQFGFHVIQRLPEPPLEQVRDQIKDELLAQRGDQTFLDFLQQQRAKAKVHVNPQFGVWDPASGVRPSQPLGNLESGRPTPSK